jgi:hypothetical protein
MVDELDKRDLFLLFGEFCKVKKDLAKTDKSIARHKNASNCIPIFYHFQEES